MSSSLLEKAFDALGAEADDKSEEWLNKLSEQLIELIEQTEDPELREEGRKAWQVVMLNKDKIIGLGKRSFILFVSHIAANRQNEAAKEYYRSKASAREIIDSILDDAFDLDKIRRDVEAVKQEALDVVTQILKGAKYLLPLLLALV